MNTFLYGVQAAVLLAMTGGVLAVATHLARAATPGLGQLLEALAPVATLALARVRRALSQWRRK